MTPDAALDVLETWFEKRRPRKGALVPRGTMYTGLVILDRLKKQYDLSYEAHIAGKQGQIQGLNAGNVRRVLRYFGNETPVPAEGGRTNRGNPQALKTLLTELRTLGLEDVPEDQRIIILDEMQRYLSDRVEDWYNRQRLTIAFEHNKTSWDVVHNLLTEVKQRRDANVSGIVAQHLVGAKLQVRFPEIPIGQESASTADMQSGRSGDFLIEDTVFHVTMAPMDKLYDKCLDNVRADQRVYILVPDELLASVRQTVNVNPVYSSLAGHVAVESIESFVSQNLEELSSFSRDKLRIGLRKLLDVYNSRIEAVETDASTTIEIPQNLR